MTDFIIEGVKVTLPDGFRVNDAIRIYWETALNIAPQVLDETPLEKIEVVECEDGGYDVNYTLHGQPFERIRRITGYLTGSLDSWNNSKRAEERERVKHDTQRVTSSSRTFIED